MRRAHTRLVGQDEENGFALIFSLLLIFIVASLSIAVAGIVYNQVKPTQYERKSIATVNAATAGLQVSLDQIRAASTLDAKGTLVGVLQRLRCTPGNSGATFSDSSGNTVQAPGATFGGYVNSNSGATASGGTLKFQTSVAYYQLDPSDKPLSWLSAPANVMSCPLSTAPMYAYVQTHGSTATGTVSGNRTQHATYKFKTSNQNVLGGRLASVNSSPAMCIDTGSPEPSPGPVTMQPCLALGTPQQQFSYRTDLTLFFQGDPTLNLCLQAPPSTGGNVTLQTCVVPATDPATKTPVTYPYVAGQQAQEWSFNDNGHFATADNGGGVTGTCMQPNGQVGSVQAAAGTYVQTAACEGSTDSHNAWSPDAQVGAGKAGGNVLGVPGAPTNQYVNYAEFGRCLDITGQQVTADHLIAYPCKQAPDKSTLTFNQVWTFNKVDSTYGTMTVNYGGMPYCLTAPASADGYYITVNPYSTGSTPCSTSPSDAQLWQPTGVLAGNYPNSYELINKSLGLCMSASSAPNGDLTTNPDWSNIIVETCNGTLREKWNAPPTNPNTGVSNISEDAGGAN